MNLGIQKMGNFVEHPNLPEGKVTVVALGESYVSALEPLLRPYNVRVLSCPDNPFVDSRLRSHIDLSVFHLGINKFALSENAIKGRFIEELKKLGAEITVSCFQQAPLYPNDANLCALSLGSRVYHNINISDILIRQHFLGRFTHVRQGYAKCAVCPVAEGAAITSDTGMARTLRKYGLDVLEIASAPIELEGFSEGFIGGAAFKLAPDILAFTGRLDWHIDKAIILAFLKKHGVKPVFLSSGPIFDIGSVIPICEVR